MPTLKEVRTALANTAKSGVAIELNVYDKMPDDPILPAFIVMPTDGDFMGAMGKGMDTWWFNGYILCNRGVLDDAQDLLDSLIASSGPNSIPRALYNGIGLESTDATVTHMGGYSGSFEEARTQVIGAYLKIRVITDGRA